jgi:hypothetical protein
MTDSTSSTRKQFDFDEWHQLANTDPDAFEQKRQKAIKKIIQSAPKAKQPRLRGLQWQIDQARHLSNTPLAACIKISKLMWDSVLGENGLLVALQGLDYEINPGPNKSPGLASTGSRRTAEILQFQPLERASEAR